MSRFKLFALIALIAFAFAVILIGDALAGERGNLVRRLVFHVTTFQSVKVGDVEGHTLWLVEQKAITFNQKWGGWPGYDHRHGGRRSKGGLDGWRI